PAAAGAVGGPPERHPDVGVDRRRVVDPRPSEAELVGEGDVIGRLGAGREGGGDVHQREALAYWSRSTCLTILPLGLRGIVATISSCSGIFCIISPLSLRKSTISSNSSGSPASCS